MRRSRTLLLAVLLLAPAAVRAADVPVVYTVDTTALKAAISGTNLSVQLYTDAACTSLAHTQVITVDNVSLLSVLKRSKPKNGAKPPKTTDIRAVLTGVAPAAPLYAKVTGTGITPVGGPCQVQPATTVGAIPTGFVVKDTNGTIVGTLQDGALVMSDAGTPVSTFASPLGFSQSSSFGYASGNCTGTKLTYAAVTSSGFIHQQVGFDGTTLYYGPLTAPVTTLNSADYSPEIPANCTNPGQVFVPPNRCCCTSPVCFSPLLTNYAPALSMDVSPFVPPFTASFQ